MTHPPFSNVGDEVVQTIIGTGGVDESTLSPLRMLMCGRVGSEPSDFRRKKSYIMLLKNLSILVFNLNCKFIAGVHHDKIKFLIEPIGAEPIHGAIIVISSYPG